MLTHLCILREMLESQKQWVMAVLREAARSAAEAPLPAAAGKSARAAASAHASMCTIQSYCMSLVLDVPVPPPGLVQVRTAVGDDLIPWERPPSNAAPTPLDTLCLRLLFTCLPIDDIVRLWGVLLAEGKVLLHAQHAALLWPVTHALTCLLAPLAWAHTTIPLLPPSLDLETFMDAPCPFLVGVTTQQLHSAGVTLAQRRRPAWSEGGDPAHRGGGGILAALRSPGGGKKTAGNKPPSHVCAVLPAGLPDDVTLVDLAGGGVHVPVESGTERVPTELEHQMLGVLQRSAAHLYAPSAAALLMSDLGQEVKRTTAQWGAAATEIFADTQPNDATPPSVFAGSVAAASGHVGGGSSGSSARISEHSSEQGQGATPPSVETTAETVFHSTGKFKRRRTVNVFRDALVSLIGDFDDFLVHDKHVRGGEGGLQFDHDAAIAARCDGGGLYKQLVRSQAFAAFLAARLSPAGALSPGVLWFDAVVDAAAGADAAGDAAAAALGEEELPPAAAARAFLKDPRFHVARSVIVPAPAATGGGDAVRLWRRQADAEDAAKTHVSPPIGQLPSADDVAAMLVHAASVLGEDGTGDRRRSSLQHRRQSSGNTLSAKETPVFQPIQEHDDKTRSWLSGVGGGSKQRGGRIDPPLTGFASPPLGKRSMLAHTPAAASMRKTRRNTARNIIVGGEASTSEDDSFNASASANAPIDTAGRVRSAGQFTSTNGRMELASATLTPLAPLCLLDLQSDFASQPRKVQLLLNDVTANMLCSCKPCSDMTTTISRAQIAASGGFSGASAEGGAGGGSTSIMSPGRPAAPGTWPAHRRTASAPGQSETAQGALSFMGGQLQLRVGGRGASDPPCSWHAVQMLAGDTQVSPMFHVEVKSEQTAKGLSFLLQSGVESPLAELLRTSVVAVPPRDSPAGAALRQISPKQLERVAATGRAGGGQWAPPLPAHVASAIREVAAQEHPRTHREHRTPSKARRTSGDSSSPHDGAPSTSASGDAATAAAESAQVLLRQLYGEWCATVTSHSTVSAAASGAFAVSPALAPMPADLSAYDGPTTGACLELYRDLFAAYGAMGCSAAVLFLWDEFQSWQEQQLMAARNIDELMGAGRGGAADLHTPPPVDSLASSGSLQSHWLASAALTPSGPSPASGDRLSTGSAFVVPSLDVLLNPPPHPRKGGARHRPRGSSAFASSASVASMLDAMQQGRSSLGSEGGVESNEPPPRSRAGSSGSLSSVLRHSSLVSQWMSQVRSVFCDTLTALFKCGAAADALRLLLHATGVSTEGMEGGVSDTIGSPLPASPVKRSRGRPGDITRQSSGLGPKHSSSTAARRTLQLLRRRSRTFKQLQLQVDAPWLGLKLEPLSSDTAACRSVLDWERVFSVLEEAKVTHAELGGSSDSTASRSLDSSKPCDLVSLCDQVQSALAALTCIDTEQFGFDTSLGASKGSKGCDGPSLVLTSADSDRSEHKTMFGAVVVGFSAPHGGPSPAQAAGLRHGDIILAVHDHATLREEHVCVLDSLSQGRPPVKLTVARARVSPAASSKRSPLSPSATGNASTTTLAKFAQRGAKRGRNSLPPPRGHSRSAASMESLGDLGTTVFEPPLDPLVQAAAAIGLTLTGGDSLQCPVAGCGASHSVSQAVACATSAPCTGPQREYTIPCRVCGKRFAARLQVQMEHAPCGGDGDLTAVDESGGGAVWVLMLPANTLLASANTSGCSEFHQLRAEKPDVFWCCVLFLLDAGTAEVLQKVLGWGCKDLPGGAPLPPRDRSSLLSCSTAGESSLSGAGRGGGDSQVQAVAPPPAPGAAAAAPAAPPFPGAAGELVALRRACDQLELQLGAVQEECVQPVWRAAQGLSLQLRLTREQLRNTEWRRVQALARAATSRSGVAVVVRCRPGRTSETHQGNASQESPPAIRCLPGGRVLVEDGSASAHGAVMRFDAALGQRTGQEGVFAHFEPIAVGALHGVNGCILAYGQTGSGKTHTMQGPGDLGTEVACTAGRSDLPEFDVRDPCLAVDSTESHHGVLQRVLASVFASAKLEQHAVPDSRVSLDVTLSAVEIHNDTFVDLLCSQPPPAGGGGKVSIQRSTAADGSVTIQLRGAATHAVGGVQGGLRLLRSASAARRVANNGVHSGSSRSHLCIVLQVEVTRESASGDAVASSAKLVICDLAGSERLAATKLHEAAAGDSGGLSGAFGSPTPKQAAAAERLKEAQAINGSLTALGNVVSALSKGGGGSAKEGGGAPRHIPYRDSKLTSLLQDCLGGTARCAFLVAVSPDAQDGDETRSTLAFAARLKHIKATAPKAHMHSSAGDQLKAALAAAEAARRDAAAARASAAKWQAQAEAAAAAAAAAENAAAVSAAAAAASRESLDSASSGGSRGTKRERGGTWGSEGGGDTEQAVGPFAMPATPRGRSAARKGEPVDTVAGTTPRRVRPAVTPARYDMNGRRIR